MNKPKFTYDDIVSVLPGAPVPARRGSKGWIIAVFPTRQGRPGSAFEGFPDGPVYTVEFEDGETAELHEDWVIAEEAAQ